MGQNNARRFSSLRRVKVGGWLGVKGVATFYFLSLKRGQKPSAKQNRSTPPPHEQKKKKIKSTRGSWVLA